MNVTKQKASMQEALFAARRLAAFFEDHSYSVPFLHTVVAQQNNELAHVLLTLQQLSDDGLSDEHNEAVDAALESVTNLVKLANALVGR